jgi:NADP-dependent aldehyde dehydrogenase
VFVFPNALASRGEELGQQWANSLAMGAGQFCTNPGVVFLPKGHQSERFITSAKQTLQNTPPQWMLTSGICEAFQSGTSSMGDLEGVEILLEQKANARQALPNLIQTDMKTWLENDILSHEVFGPTGLIVLVEDIQDYTNIARRLKGQLTCTLQMDKADSADAKPLMPILERKAGRVLANGFPTGVEVSQAMVHGGPYPASTNFGATSVGTMSIRRFLRPVCYQSIPEDLLPEDLQSLG